MGRRPCSLRWTLPPLIKAGHYRHPRLVEFLHFMNRLVAGYPGRELHVILDNLNTHKPKHDGWRARQKNVHIHFTPTQASWLNQVEVRFSILSSNAWPAPVSPQQVRDQTARLTPSSGPIMSSSRSIHDVIR